MSKLRRVPRLNASRDHLADQFFRLGLADSPLANLITTTRATIESALATKTNFAEIERQFRIAVEETLTVGIAQGTNREFRAKMQVLWSEVRPRRQKLGS